MALFRRCQRQSSHKHLDGVTIGAGVSMMLPRSISVWALTPGSKSRIASSARSIHWIAAAGVAPILRFAQSAEGRGLQHLLRHRIQVVQAGHPIGRGSIAWLVQHYRLMHKDRPNDRRTRQNHLLVIE